MSFLKQSLQNEISLIRDAVKSIPLHLQQLPIVTMALERVEALVQQIFISQTPGPDISKERMRNAILSTPIENAGFRSETAEELVKRGFKTVRELVAKSEMDLVEMGEGFWYNHIQEINSQLSFLGLHLTGNIFNPGHSSLALHRKSEVPQNYRFGEVNFDRQKSPAVADIKDLVVNTALGTGVQMEAQVADIKSDETILEEVTHSRAVKAILGETFAKLTVVGEAGRQHATAISWLAKCRCACGNVCYYQPSHVRTGVVTSCRQCDNLVGTDGGRKKTRKKQDTGDQKKLQVPNTAVSKTPEYQAWRNATSNRAAVRLASGGIRNGIEKTWKDDFKVFLADVGYRPTPHHQFCRKDRNKGWRRGNVGWRDKAGYAPGLKSTGTSIKADSKPTKST